MTKKNTPQLEQVETKNLIPYARNSRTHSETQVAQIAASIREFGFNNPVLIGFDNDIIAGHGRVLAAQKLQLEKVPCIRIDHLTENQKRAYVIADNRIALNAGWDEEMLKLELADLKETEIDLELLGFSDSEITALITEEEIKAPTDFAEMDENIETEHQCPQCQYKWSGKSK
jgi:ParB-like chromosome segregation protein Spo0J